MKAPNKIFLIAPCGMNCSVCRAYLREKNKCHGCRFTQLNKPISRVNCKIKNCEVFENGEAKYCFECKNFPCRRLEILDKRYRTYKMSMVENLKNIKNGGIRKFVEAENSRWRCNNCGGIICVHTRSCCNCGKEKI